MQRMKALVCIVFVTTAGCASGAATERLPKSRPFGTVSAFTSSEPSKCTDVTCRCTDQGDRESCVEVASVAPTPAMVVRWLTRACPNEPDVTTCYSDAELSEPGAFGMTLGEMALTHECTKAESTEGECADLRSRADAISAKHESDLVAARTTYYAKKEQERQRRLQRERERKQYLAEHPEADPTYHMRRPRTDSAPTPSSAPPAGPWVTNDWAKNEAAAARRYGDAIRSIRDMMGPGPAAGSSTSAPFGGGSRGSSGTSASSRASASRGASAGSRSTGGSSSPSSSARSPATSSSSSGRSASRDDQPSSRAGASSSSASKPSAPAQNQGPVCREETATEDGDGKLTEEQAVRDAQLTASNRLAKNCAGYIKPNSEKFFVTRGFDPHTKYWKSQATVRGQCCK